MNQLGIVVNEVGKYSEIFLRQLFESIQDKAILQIYTFKNKENISLKGNIKVTLFPSKISYKFLLFLLSHLYLPYSRVSFKEYYFEFLLKYIKEKDVYFPFIALTRNFSKAISRSENRKRIFTSIRGSDITITPYHKPEVIPIYRQINKHIYKMHFLSEELKENTFDYQIYPKYSQVIYQGVDTTKFTFNKNINKDKLRIITVGRLHFVKGLEYAILVANELNKKEIDFSFNIIGEGKERVKLEIMIKSLGLEKKVFLKGKMEREELLKEYLNSNFYIHTHIVNGVSNSMLEALACNLKVVVFDSNIASYEKSILKELIIETPKFDYKTMAERLNILFEAKELGNNENHVLELLKDFSLEKQTNEFVKFFEWV